MIGATNVFTALGGKQATLTYTSLAGGISLGSGSVVKGLKAAAPVTMTEAANAITLGLDTTNLASTSDLTSGLSDKQDALLFSNPTGGVSLYGAGNIVKGLKAVAPISMLDDENMITLGITFGVYEPVFTVVEPLQKTLVAGDWKMSIDPDALNPFWVAGRVNGSTVTKMSTKGKHDYTVTRVSTGLFWISWTDPHPDGTNFTAFFSGNGFTGANWNILHDFTVGGGAPYGNTEYGVSVITRDNNFTLLNGSFSFQVLA